VFQEALTKILSQLAEARTCGLVHDYALIGGFAASAWGVPRATQDIDFAIGIGTADPQALATVVRGRYASGETDDPLRGIIHASIEAGTESIPVQLILLPPAFTALIFRDVEAVPVMERVVPVVSWQALVLLKLYAGGLQNRLDVEQILRARHPQNDDMRKVSAMAQSVGLLDEWTAFVSRMS